MNGLNYFSASAAENYEPVSRIHLIWEELRHRHRQDWSDLELWTFYEYTIERYDDYGIVGYDLAGDRRVLRFRLPVDLMRETDMGRLRERVKTLLQKNIDSLPRNLYPNA